MIAWSEGKRFQDAGFNHVTIEQVSGTFAFDSPDDSVSFILDITQDIVRFFEDQPSAHQEKIWQTVAEKESCSPPAENILST